jgi:hypothetical protein
MCRATRAAVCPQVGASCSNRAHPVSPTLLWRCTIMRSNEACVMDIAYIAIAHGFPWIAAVLGRAIGAC